MLHDIMGADRALPWLAAAFFGGYLFGSIPGGILMARLFGLGDLRKIGSGNIGATNVLRTGNKSAAALTTLFDGLKGLIPVLIFLQWGDLASQAAALGAVIGHCFPVWLRFRGGKAVATFIGVIYGLFWPVGIVVCAVWLAAAAISRISSVGGLAATLSAPIAMVLFNRWEAVLVTIFLTLIVWGRHHSNIARLLAGNEPRIGEKKEPG